MNKQLDKKDCAILAVLTENSRLSWKEVGEKVYLTGQAVGNRVQQLVEQGDIKRFTIEQHYEQLQFITIFMNSNNFSAFEKHVLQFAEIIDFNKITGEGCYFIKSCFSPDQLDSFLASIECYARYRVNHSLKKITY